MAEKEGCQDQEGKKMKTRDLMMMMMKMEIWLSKNRSLKNTEFLGYNRNMVIALTSRLISR